MDRQSFFALALVVAAAVTPRTATAAPHVLSVSPAYILSTNHEESVVNVQNITGALTMDILNQGEVEISEFKRNGSTAHFKVTRLAGGADTITLRDGSAKQAVIEVAAVACSPPIPNFVLMYPFPRNDAFPYAPTPYRSVRTFPNGATNWQNSFHKEFGRDFFIEIGTLIGGLDPGRSYKLRLFNRQGDTAASGYLDKIRQDAVRAGIAIPPVSPGAKQYFKAHVAGIRAGVPYYVQFWSPKNSCAPPLVDTAGVVLSAAPDLLSASPADILPYHHDEDTVTVKNVRGALTMDILNQGVIAVSEFKRSGATARFKVSRLAGGADTITLRDSSGKQAVINVAEVACSPPTPGFVLLYPLEKDDAFPNVPTPYRSIRTFSNRGTKSQSSSHKEFARDFFVQFTQIGPDSATSYKIRLFNRRGDMAESGYLEPIRQDELPAGITIPSVTSGGPKQYFKTHIAGIKDGVPYYVQFWSPEDLCPPPQTGTAGILISATDP